MQQNQYANKNKMHYLPKNLSVIVFVLFLAEDGNFE